MAERNVLTVAVPASGVTSPKSWGSRKYVASSVEKIMKNFGKFIKTASVNSRIPQEIIAAFTAVESGGNPTAGTPGHPTQGLMQWNRNYAKSRLEDEFKRKRMTPEELDILAKYGIRFDKEGKTRAITNEDQLKPELNILIGTMILGALIDTKWGTEDGKMKLERVIVVYNAGQYGDSGKKATSGAYKTPAQLAAVVNPISAAYIGKMLGTDGALDVATKELKGLFS